MGIYLPDMEMPKSCYECPLRRRDGMDIVCPVSHERFSVADVNILEYRLNNCPLVPVPPHGRLIDADALMGNEENISFKDEWHMTVTEAFVSVKNIAHAPTILEAEEGET